MKVFFRFLAVGVFNTLLGYSVIFTCMYFAEMSPEISNVAGYAVGLVASYVLNRKYTFNSTQKRRSEILRFLGVFIFAYGANFSILVILIHKMGIHVGVSQVLAGLVYVVASFVMNKYFVFKAFVGAETTHNSNGKKVKILRISEILSMWKRSFVLVALFGLWCFYLQNAFGADRSFALYMDNEFFIGTILSSMSGTMSSGIWPLRMDTIMGGVPLYNFLQLSPFYPFYLIVLPIYSSPLDVIYSMHWITLLHILIMEINMYIFLRVISVSRLGSVIGAALVAFSANSFAYAVWMNIVAPYSWFPLYLAGLIGILKYPQSVGYSKMALVGIVLLTLASPSQPLIHAVFVTIIFVCAFWYNQICIGESRQIGYTLGRVVGVAILALLLVAPVIIPAVLEYKNMIRWIGPFPAVIGNARIPFEAFQIDQLAITDLGGVLFKFKSGGVGSQFAGILVIALACVAVVSRPRSWIVVALVFIAVYSLISSTGINLGLAYVNYIVPILNKIREPSRFLVLFQFAVGSLAVIGIDELRKTVSEVGNSAVAKRQFLTLMLVSLIAIFTLFVVSEQIVSILPPFISVVILLVLTLVTFAARYFSLYGRHFIIGVVWGGSALAVLAIDVPWVPPAVSSSQYLSSGSLALEKAIERVLEFDPNREYRVIFDGEIDRQQAAMLASYRGVRTFNSYFNPAPRRQFEVMYHHGSRSDNYFRILGAKYLICRGCSEDSLLGYKHRESVAGYEILESEDVLPHSYILQYLNSEFKGETDFITRVSNFNPINKHLIVEPGVAVGLNDVDSAAENNCISREDVRTVNRSAFVVQCNSSGVMVLNEFFDEAWVTSVDGIKVQSRRINGSQIGVPFPPGAHIIEFQYSPKTFRVAIWIMLIGVFVLIYILAMRKTANEP